MLSRRRRPDGCCRAWRGRQPGFRRNRWGKIPGIESGATVGAPLYPAAESLRVAASNRAFEAIAAIASGDVLPGRADRLGSRTRRGKAASGIVLPAVPLEV